MHMIYLGYSTSLSAQEVIQYFDIDSKHPHGHSKFEQNFGADYVEPGSFEVYGRNEYGQCDFDENLLRLLVPFSLDSSMAETLDFNRLKCVFYIETTKLQILENEDIKLIGPFEIDKYNFE